MIRNIKRTLVVVVGFISIICCPIISYSQNKQNIDSVNALFNLKRNVLNLLDMCCVARLNGINCADAGNLVMLGELKNIRDEYDAKFLGSLVSACINSCVLCSTGRTSEYIMRKNIINEKMNQLIYREMMKGE